MEIWRGLVSKEEAHESKAQHLALGASQRHSLKTILLEMHRL